MPNADPFALLKQDHRKVERIFKEIHDTTERAEKTRQELFENLKTALEYHTKVEEQFLYPVLEEVGLTHDMTLEAEEEHNVVKTLLADLAGMSPTDEEWVAKITVMKESLEHHVEEEETDLFIKAKKVMTEEQQETLSDAIIKLREEADQ